MAKQLDPNQTVDLR